MNISAIASNEVGSSVRAKLNAAISGVSVVTRTVTASFSLVADDDLDLVFVNASAGVTCTLPNDRPVGTTVTIVQVGAGAVTFAAQAGGSRVARGNLFATAGQYAIASVVVYTNTTGTNALWIVAGDLA